MTVFAKLWTCLLNILYAVGRKINEEIFGELLVWYKSKAFTATFALNHYY